MTAGRISDVGPYRLNEMCMCFAAAKWHVIEK